MVADDLKAKIKEQSKIYYENNKEIIKQKSKEYRNTHKEEIAKHKKDYRQQHHEYIYEKIPCDVCGKLTSRDHMARHKRSQKCQPYTSSEDPKDNTTCCDRCGKSVPKRYMWRHKQTIDCKWFPATQLNIPIEVASDMVAKLPDTLTFEEKLKDICDQYKDGYVTPVKEKKPWQIKNEQIRKQLFGDEPIVWNICRKT